MDDGRYADYDATVLIEVPERGRFVLTAKDRHANQLFKENGTTLPSLSWNATGYTAVLHALDHAKHHGARTVAVMANSLTVTQQLDGTLPPPSEKLSQVEYGLYERFRRLRRDFAHVFVGYAGDITHQAPDPLADAAAFD